jgi:hypothetical protein
MNLKPRNTRARGVPDRMAAGARDGGEGDGAWR